MAKAQSFWGPPGGIHSKDYVLRMAKPNPLQIPYTLESHTLDAPSQNLTDALMFNRTEIKNGKIATKAIVGRAAEETSRDYPLGFPNGILSSPALWQAVAGGCETNFYEVFLCPTNVCYEHFFVLPDARLDPPVEAENPITVDDVVELRYTTTLHTSERLEYYHLDGYVLTTLDLSTGAGTLQAIHAAPENCPDCGNCVNRVYVGGNDGAAASETAYLAVSTDRGATFTEIDIDTLSGGLSSDLIVTSINSDGEYLWVALSDDADPAAAAAGALIYSTDNGATWSGPAAVTSPMFTTFQLEDVFYVAGDGGEIWGSEDGINWTQVAQSATTESILDSAVDGEESLAYLVGTNGAAVVFDGTAVVDISAPLAALAVPPGDLWAVHVLARNRIQVAGETGFLAESYDGADTWTALAVTGSTDIVYALEGDEHRALAAQSGSLYERDIIHDLLYKAIDYKYSPTLTGDLVELSAAEGVNYFFGVLTTGEVILFRPCGPDYCADVAAA